MDLKKMEELVEGIAEAVEAIKREMEKLERP